MIGTAGTELGYTRRECRSNVWHPIDVEQTQGIGYLGATPKSGRELLEDTCTTLQLPIVGPVS